MRNLETQPLENPSNDLGAQSEASPEAGGNMNNSESLKGQSANLNTEQVAEAINGEVQTLKQIKNINYRLESVNREVENHRRVIAKAQEQGLRVDESIIDQHESLLAVKAELEETIDRLYRQAEKSSDQPEVMEAIEEQAHQENNKREAKKISEKVISKAHSFADSTGRKAVGIVEHLTSLSERIKREEDVSHERENEQQLLIQELRVSSPDQNLENLLDEFNNLRRDPNSTMEEKLAKAREIIAQQQIGFFDFKKKKYIKLLSQKLPLLLKDHYTSVRKMKNEYNNPDVLGPVREDLQTDLEKLRESEKEIIELTGDRKLAYVHLEEYKQKFNSILRKAPQTPPRQRVGRLFSEIFYQP